MKVKELLVVLGTMSFFWSAAAWPTVDLSEDTSRQVVVAAGTESVYNGHPTTAMLEDGKTIFCVWPTGHGGYAGNAAVSTDAGLTWTRVDDRLPDGAKLNVECPIIHRLVGPDGKSRLWVWSGFRAKSLEESTAPVGTDARKAAARRGDPMPALMSEDDGRTWKEMPPLGPKFRCVLSFQAVVRLKDGAYLGIYHRGPEACVDQPPLELMGAVTRDGGFTWSDPVVVAKVDGLNLCEPWAFRSPDGREICVLIRENHWLHPSKVIFSRDEGRTWTAPRDVPPGLSGHRHQGVVLPDGRVVVCMRDAEKGSPTVGHFVAWVGSYESIRTGRASPGDYRVKLLHSYAGGDCGYPGVHLLKDGTVVATTYVKYRPGKNRQSIVSVRFKVSETDRKAEVVRRATAAPTIVGKAASDVSVYARRNRLHEGIPSIAVDPKTGRLWATWYGGASNSEDSNNYVVLATSADKGATWREALIYDPDGEGPWRAFDCEVWVSPDGKLRWFWSERKVKLRGSLNQPDTPQLLGVYAGHSDPDAIKTDRLMMMTLDADRDPIAPFAAPREIGKGVMMCKPIVAKNGEWVLPVSHWYQEESAKLLFSSDGGATFRLSEGGATMPKQWRTFDEHCVVEMADGTFRIWARTNRGCRTSATPDRGRTWTPETTANFGFPATRTTVRRLKSGRILLVKHGNDVKSNGGGRNCLTAFLSDDEAQTWKGGLVLDPRKGGSYCDVDQAPDGTIYAIWDFGRTTTRDIHFARFSEDDILAGWGKSKTFLTLGTVSTGRLLAEDDPKAGEKDPQVAAFEKFADLAVKLPPQIRTAGIGAYSTNKLAYALNNGLAMTAKGRLWASWIAGGDSPDAFTVASYSDDCGETWSDVALVIDGHGLKPTHGNPVARNNIIGTFWLDPTGKFRLYTDQSVFHYDGRAGIWESVCENPDATGSTKWSAPRRLGHGHVINKPIVLKNGHWAMAGYLNRNLPAENWLGCPGAFRELDADRGANCYVSTDEGRTWEKRGTVDIPGEDWPETQFVQLKDGTLRVFARAFTEGHGRMLCADSTDEGRTWTKARPIGTMDNPNARFQVMRLGSGRLLFVKHGQPTAGGKDRQGRDHLTAYVSDDDGATWRGGLELYAGQASYPDCCLGPDGMIYVTHDHDRGGAAEIWLHRFTEEDVLAGRIVSPRGKLNLLVSRGMGRAVNRRR